MYDFLVVGSGLYGAVCAHIFHTSDKEVWEFVNKLAAFNNYVNSPLANYKGELYNLPFNMNTFNKLWGVVTPKAAGRRKLSRRSRDELYR